MKEDDDRCYWMMCPERALIRVRFSNGDVRRYCPRHAEEHERRGYLGYPNGAEILDEVEDYAY